MYTQAKPREARLCENRKKLFFFCPARGERERERDRERGNLKTGKLIDVCI